MGNGKMARAGRVVLVRRVIIDRCYQPDLATVELAENVGIFPLAEMERVATALTAQQHEAKDGEQVEYEAIEL